MMKRSFFNGRLWRKAVGRKNVRYRGRKDIAMRRPMSVSEDAPATEDEELPGATDVKRNGKASTEPTVGPRRQD
jgi:hypothetical protein